MHDEFQSKLLNTSDDKIYVPLAQLGVSEKKLHEHISRIRDWYRLQPHLPENGLDEKTLRRNLIYNKFNLEKTKKKIDNLLTARSLLPELFTNRDPLSTRMRYMMDIVDYSMVPQLTPENDRIVIYRMNPNDPGAFDPLVHMAFTFMMSEIRSLLDTNSQCVFIIDCQNLKLGHFLKLNASLIKKTMYAIQECFASRFSSIYILNCSPLFLKTVSMIRSLMKKKLEERVVFLENLEQLHEKISKDLLPKDLGGNLPMTSKDLSDDLRKILRTPYWRKWLTETEQIRSDESKRLGKADFILNDLIGATGTFRKLELD